MSECVKCGREEYSPDEKLREELIKIIIQANVKELYKELRR